MNHGSQKKDRFSTCATTFLPTASSGAMLASALAVALAGCGGSDTQDARPPEDPRDPPPAVGPAIALPVCDRPPQVLDEIMRVTGAASCSAVTDVHLASIDSLTLNSTGLASLPEGVFAGMTSLESLDMSDNDITTLPKGVFVGLSSLEELDLSYNAVTALPAGVFEGLSSLESLDLGWNPGAPFELALRFEPTNVGKLATSPASVQLFLAEGAPFSMTLPLTVKGGTASPDTASLPAGRSQGNVFSVTQEETGQPTRITAASLPAIPSGFSGITLAAPAAELLVPDESRLSEGGLRGADSAGSWCPGNAVVTFTLENGKTVSICKNADSSDWTYFYGTLGEPLELEYRGPLLGTISGISGYSHDLAGLGRYGFDGPLVSVDVSQEAVAIAAAAQDSRGFFLVGSVGCCGGEETAFLFRSGGWEYAVRFGYSRIVNPDLAAEHGDYSDWQLITLISPDGQGYTIR